MRRRCLPLGALLLSLAAGAGAARADVAVSGTVVASESRWVGERTRIVTESVIRDAGGDEVTVTQLGGRADGYAQIVVHAPPVLALGDTVSLRAARPATADGPALDVLEVTRLVRGTTEFVTSKSSTGLDLVWSSGCVFVAYADEGTNHIEGDLEFQVMDQVLDTWEAATASCSYLRFEREGRIASETEFDSVNVIKFREVRWCRPATEDAPEKCHNPSAAGLTTLTFVDDESSPRDGEIVDADIELNAVDFAYSVGGNTNGSPSCLADLANTLTHEIGHLLGLDHTCWNGQGDRPVDDQGDPIPTCATPQLPPEITEATMYNFQDCGETKKASLEQDDIDGACSLYPSADDPGTCKPASLGGGGCSAADDGDPAGNGAPFAVVMLLLVARGLARRSCRRAAPRSGRS